MSGLDAECERRQSRILQVVMVVMVLHIFMVVLRIVCNMQAVTPKQASSTVSTIAGQLSLQVCKFFGKNQIQVIFQKKQVRSIQVQRQLQVTAMSELACL